MTDAALQDLHRRFSSLERVVVTLLNRRLSRQEMADRLGVTTRTLARMIDAGKVPPPRDGKWLLSEVVEWEAQR